MSYSTVEKRDRNRLLMEYVWNHPEATLRETGNVFGITPQRVCHLLKKAGRRKSCWNCYHYLGNNLCHCRERSDIINPCRDWHPADKKAK